MPRLNHAQVQTHVLTATRKKKTKNAPAWFLEQWIVDLPELLGWPTVLTSGKVKVILLVVCPVGISFFSELLGFLCVFLRHRTRASAAVCPHLLVPYCASLQAGEHLPVQIYVCVLILCHQE